MLIGLVHTVPFLGEFAFAYDADLHTPPGLWGVGMVLVACGRGVARSLGWPAAPFNAPLGADTRCRRWSSRGSGAGRPWAGVRLIRSCRYD